jgi:hypothetical protein
VASSGVGGAGSTAVTSTAASSTTGGAGGSPLSCAGLALSGEPITCEPTPSEHGSRPSLVPATDDGSLVSVVFARTSVKSPNPTFTRIVSATLSPWGTFPKSLGVDLQASILGGDPFAAAPAMAAGQPGFSVLLYLPTDEIPSYMHLAPSAAVATSYDPYPTGKAWGAGELAWPIALARGASGHLAVYELGIGPSAFMSLAVVDATSLDVSVANEVACASAPFAADAVPTKGGFLVATAAGRAFGDCPLDDGVPGVAKDLQILKVDEVTKEISLMALFEGVDAIAHIALAKRAAHSGAWVVWQETGASSFIPPPIRAVPLDESGSQAGPIVDITSDGQTTGPFEATALGERLSVAWIDSLDPSTPTIRLDLFDEVGMFVAGTSLSTGAAWLYDASLSLLASPDTTQLLVAWADGESPAPANVRVARFSCIPEP